MATQSLTLFDQVATTMTSREIAELTGKRHADVMRDIRVMIEQLEADANLRWHCESTTYIDEQGKPRSQFELDRDTTFNLLAGYDPVSRMKIIKRWQELEQPKTPGDALVQMALSYREHERRIMALEARQAETKEQIENLLGGDDYTTVKAFARKNRLPGDRKTLAAVGRRATAICKIDGIQWGEVPDEMWGSVHSYPLYVLDTAFQQVMH